MRKIKPEEVPPLCDICQSPMIITRIGLFKEKNKWTCKNKCGGRNRDYYEITKNKKGRVRI